MKQTFRISSYVLVGILLVVASVAARPIPPLEGLEALRKGFADISDFTAEISQEKRVSVMKRTMQMSGTVRFRKPDLFFMEIVSPYSSRMLLRNDTIEQILAGSSERSRIVLPSGQGLKQWITRFSTPMTTLPDGVGIHADLSGGTYTLTIAPESGGQIRELVISFLGDGTFRRLIITEKNGDRSMMTFKKVRRNTGLSERDFQL